MNCISLLLRSINSRYINDPKYKYPKDQLKVLQQLPEEFRGLDWAILKILSKDYESLTSEDMRFLVSKDDFDLPQPTMAELDEENLPPTVNEKQDEIVDDSLHQIESDNESDDEQESYGLRRNPKKVTFTDYVT